MKLLKSLFFIFSITFFIGCISRIIHLEDNPKKILGTVIVGADPGEKHQRIEAFFNSAASINSKWIRIGLIWSIANPSMNIYDFSEYDWIFNKAKEYNLNILAVVIFTPQWASADTSNKQYYILPPTNKIIGDYSSSLGTVGTGYDYLFKFAKEISSRYSNIINHWEFWNEPDIVNGFLYDYDNNGSTANEYAKMLKYFYYGIKEGNPEAQVLLGGIANSSIEANCDIQFIEKILNDSLFPAKDNFDIFNIHLNFKSPDEITKDIDKYRQLLLRYSLETKPIWITENSYSPLVKFQNIRGYQKGEESFNKYIKDILTLEINSDVEAVFWAVLFDYPDSTNNDFPYKFSGLFTNDLREKYAAKIFKNIHYTVH